jgi:hypothetical protein
MNMIVSETMKNYNHQIKLYYSSSMVAIFTHFLGPYWGINWFFKRNGFWYHNPIVLIREFSVIKPIKLNAFKAPSKSFHHTNGPPVCQQEVFGFRLHRILTVFTARISIHRNPSIIISLEQSIFASWVFVQIMIFHLRYNDCCIYRFCLINHTLYKLVGHNLYQ